MNRLAKKYGWFTGHYSLEQIRTEKRKTILGKLPIIGAFVSRWASQWAPVSIYLCRPDPNDPLTYHHVSGFAIRLYRALETDKGSVPPLLQPICPDDRFLLAWLFHDLHFEDHAMEVIHESETTCAVPDWLPEAALSLKLGESARLSCTRLQADDCMWAGIRATGGTWLQGMLIWRAVHGFGRRIWAS
jgi:hypothetical protein